MTAPEFGPTFEDLSEPPGTVLVVVAHPDDIDFGIAGTAAALTAAGSRVVYRLATSGEAGGPDEMDRAELKALRESEQRLAADAVGVTDVEFLGMPDGHLEANLELRKAIVKAIRTVKPDLMLIQNPERRWDSVYASHPDHLAVGEASMAAVYPDSRNPHFLPELLDEGYEPHTVPEVWVGSLEPSDVFVDISDVFDRKVKALSSHSSQVGWIEDIDKLLRDWATGRAATHGFAEGSMIETFRRVHTG